MMMKNKDSIAEQLVKFFADRAYTWRIDGELKNTTKEDFIEAFDAIEKRLPELEDGTLITTGRLVYHINDRYVDVYVLIGDLNG